MSDSGGHLVNVFDESSNDPPADSGDEAGSESEPGKSIEESLRQVARSRETRASRPRKRSTSRRKKVDAQDDSSSAREPEVGSVDPPTADSVDPSTRGRSPTQPTEVWMTVEEAAEATGLPPSTLAGWRND